MEHPGKRIQERFMEPLGINASQLARALGVDRSTVSRLLSEKQPITPTMAARLGACFRVPARWFLLMQADYDAETIGSHPEATAGTTPLTVDPDWLLTPDGAISLETPEPAEGDEVAVRTVQLDNGALALLGADS